MSAIDTRLHRTRDAARSRALAQAVLLASPWLVVAAVLAWRMEAAPWSLLVPVAVAAASLAYAWRATRGFDDRWLARQLDAQRDDMDDSADLLFADPATTNPLERLQLARLQQRLQDGPALDFRSRWQARRLLVGAALAGACVVAIVLLPAAPGPTTADGAGAEPVAATARQPARLVGRRIDIRPPEYTGLPARTVESMSAKVAEGSDLHWSLRFDPMPGRAELVFLDGERVSLRRDGDDWTARRRIDQPTLYRVQFGRHQSARLHRLDVVNDRAPRLRALQPQRTLSEYAPGQRHWQLAFEASDDHGLAATAQLRITRTEGSGENITTSDRDVALRGQGNATRRRYTHRVDLDALGLSEGEEVIARLSVSDRRAPTPQTTRSPSYILRWTPPRQMDSGALEGLVKRVMPEYFRSQRQIIIDAEALLERKDELAAPDYAQRSDAIGVDQRLLRLRYGQFLGEETEESEGPPIMPTNDAPEPARGDDGHSALDPAHDDDHGDAGAQRQAVFGEEQAVLERFGHTHDHAEAATLLDPTTRKLLKAALDEMWQSELNLRQARPEGALPYARRALDFIKQVQQAERIYLPRVASRQPEIDFGRRLGGDRSGLRDRDDVLAGADAADPLVADAWRALASMPTMGSEPDDPLDLDALVRWIDTHDIGSGDRLELAAAMDALRRDRTCARCRERLRGLLWPLLARPPAAVEERMPGGRSGKAYLDALEREARR